MNNDYVSENQEKPEDNNTSNINKCQNCGAELELGAAFCGACGSPISQSPQGQNIPVNPSILQYNNNVVALQKKKSSRATIWITIGIVAALILAVVGFVGGRTFVRNSIYQNACYNLDTGDYYSAYIDFYYTLDGYKDSEEKVDECVYEWIDYILYEGDVYDAELFSETVNLNSEHYSTVYSMIMGEINVHNSLDYWDQTQKAQIIYRLLQPLPPSYEDVGSLTRFFMALAYGDIYPLEDYVIDNKALLESLWHLGVVKDLVANDDAICGFLKGYWKTSDDSYYMNFYENDEGTISSNFNLPWVEEPAGTEYYNIKNMIYYWEDANYNQLAKVFRFTIVDYDTINIYCYKNSRTYKLYR